MEEMHPHDLASPPLHAIFGAARQFGLTETEVWLSVDDALGHVDFGATVSESTDEIAAALAQRILSKERHAIAERRRAALDEV